MTKRRLHGEKKEKNAQLRVDQREERGNHKEKAKSSSYEEGNGGIQSQNGTGEFGPTRCPSGGRKRRKESEKGIQKKKHPFLPQKKKILNMSGSSLGV